MGEEAVLFPCDSNRTIRRRSQTSAVNSAGKIVGRRDPHCQAVYALKNLKKTLDAAGVNLTDVIRTRVYLARFEHWEASRSA